MSEIKEMDLFGDSEKQRGKIVAVNSKDNDFKRFFSRRDVLAQLLRLSIPELRGRSLESLENAIISVEESEEQDNEAGYIALSNTGNRILGCANIFYDILLNLDILGNNRGEENSRVKLTIDFEMQKTYLAGYPLGKRSMYYASRALSTELRTLKTGREYKMLHPVYSIWIVLQEVPKDLQGNVVEFRMLPTHSDISAGEDFNKLVESMDLLRVKFLFLSEQLLYGKLDDELEFVQAAVFNKSEMSHWFAELNIDEEAKQEMKGMNDMRESLAELLKGNAEQKIEMAKAKGREEGREEAMDRMKKLYLAMEKDHRGEEFKNRMFDSDWVELMMDRYNI